MQPGALRLPATLTAPTSNAATVLPLTLGDLYVPGEAATIFDAKAVTLAVFNNTDQAIAANGLTLFFSDPAAPGAVITYTPTVSSIASGAKGTAYVPLLSGKLAHLSLQVTFSSAPAAAKTVSVAAIVEGPGSSAGSLAGSSNLVQVADGTGSGRTAGVNNFSAGTTNVGLGNLVSAAAGNYLSNTGGWDPRLEASPNAHQGIPATPVSGVGTVAITTATTTAVKGGAGTLGTIVNTGGVASTGTLIVYDNTAASGKKVLSLPTGIGATPIPVGIPCGTGITIVTSAADSWAVSYA